MKFNMVASRHLEKSIWRHDSAVRWPNVIKFGTPMQNACAWWVGKMETRSTIPTWRTSVFTTGSSNNSDADWDISSKFGAQIDLDIPRRAPSLKSKPRVDFRLYGRHLKNRYDVITPPALTDFDQIWYSDATCHAHDDESVKIETGSK